MIANLYRAVQRKMMSALILCCRTGTPNQVIDEVEYFPFTSFKKLLILPAFSYTGLAQSSCPRCPHSVSCWNIRFLTPITPKLRASTKRFSPLMLNIALPSTSAFTKNLSRNSSKSIFTITCAALKTVMDCESVSLLL